MHPLLYLEKRRSVVSTRPTAQCPAISFLRRRDNLVTGGLAIDPRILRGVVSKEPSINRIK